MSLLPEVTSHVEMQRRTFTELLDVTARYSSYCVRNVLRTQVYDVDFACLEGCDFYLSITHRNKHQLVYASGRPVVFTVDSREFGIVINCPVN